MKSFCIKTNHSPIIDYLLKSLDTIPDIIFVKRKFKIYYNIIIHYVGEDMHYFITALSQILTDSVILFYEPRLLHHLIHFHYFYFDEYEKNSIEEFCYDLEDGLIESENPEVPLFYDREKQVLPSFIDYIQENKSMILDGFVYFRLADYMATLEKMVEYAVNQYVVEKEYTEFIDLLKIYIESNSCKQDLVHLIYTNGESILLDKHKSIISITEHTVEAKYLSDISFSSNDYTLNTLLTLLPKKIEVHIIGESDDFIHTLELIFGNRISLCKDCHICRTYRILNNVSHK